MESTNPIITNRRTAILAAVLWGGLLAALAARPFLAEILALEGWPPPPPPSTPAELDHEVERLESALALSPSATLAERAALARMRLSEAYGGQSAWGRREAERAEALARTSLSLAPGNPFLWLWLSQVDARLHGMSALSARAWMSSARSGPFDPDLAEERLWLGLVQEPVLDEAGHAELAGQIRSVAAWSMTAVVAAAMRADSTATVRRVLAAEPPRLAAFNADVARYPQ